MYQLTKIGGLQRIADGACIPHDEGSPAYVEFLAWEATGGRPSPYVQSQEDLQDAVTVAVQARLDDFAKMRGYDDVLSACSYAVSKSARFSAEGAYCVAARDAHWETCYQILADVQAGKRPMPTLGEVIAELPPLAWPV